MFVSDADFDFATEQIKKLKLTVFEVTAMPLGSNCVVPSYWKGCEDNRTHRNLWSKAAQLVGFWSFQCIYFSQFHAFTQILNSGFHKISLTFPTLDESLSFYELRWIVKDRIEMDNLGYFGKTCGVFTI